VKFILYTALNKLTDVIQKNDTLVTPRKHLENTKKLNSHCNHKNARNLNIAVFIKS